MSRYFFITFLFVTFFVSDIFCKDIYISAVGKYGNEKTIVISKSKLEFCVSEGGISDNSQWYYKIFNDTIYISDNDIYFKPRFVVKNNSQIFDFQDNRNYYNKKSVDKLLGKKDDKVYVCNGKVYAKKNFRQLNKNLRGWRKNSGKIEFLKPSDAESVYGIYGVKGAVVITIND